VNLERRAAVELRASGGKTPKLVGYASVFDSPSQDLGGFIEIVKPGAFARTLQSNERDPLALVQHLPHLVLGRRSAGTLRLAEDAKGLHFEIDPPDTVVARDLMVSVERGDIRGASFAFNVPRGGDRWDVRGDKAVRELRDVDLHEITVTAQPAYTDTTVALRTYQHRFVPVSRLRMAKRWLESCA
jgi:HK97 family phage prohead protease